MKYYGDTFQGYPIQASVVHQSFLEKETSKQRPGGCDITHRVKTWRRMLSVTRKMP